MEITWDRIQALGKRLNDSRELEISLAVGMNDRYVVFTKEEKQSVIARDVKGRTHMVTAKGLWDLVCDCPDFLYNDHLHGGWCKHIMAVMEYRGHTPVLIKTLADGKASTEPEPTSSGELWSSDPTYDLERKIKELY